MENFIPLEAIQIANPCSADWNKMQGDDRTRFCQSCAKNVYNIAGLSRSEAADLIRAREGELCIRFFRRADGTILTDDCPVGLRPARNGAVWAMRAALAGVAACAAIFVGIAQVANASSSGTNGINTAMPMNCAPGLRNRAPFASLQNVQPFKTVLDVVDPVQIMGDIAMPAPPAPTPEPTEKPNSEN